jgi:ribonuclease J
VRIRIHQGAQEIGGNCVELEHDGKHLLLDLGLPLNAGDKPATLPDIARLPRRATGTLLGLIVSHAHQDHYGLVPWADPAIPIYMGEAAARILDAAAFFSPVSAALSVHGFLEHRKPFPLGPFTITPYLVDHSAYDAYALLVDDGERRLFYTGDFRAHGRKRSLVHALFAHPPHNVDTLLIEGTNVRLNESAGEAIDETQLELRMAKLFQSTLGLVVVFSSAQNIDRLVSVYRASLRAGRDLVVDLYTATVAAATNRPSIPQRGFPNLRVYVPNRQRQRVIRAREFDRVDAVRHDRIFREEIRDRAGQLVVLLQGSTLRELAVDHCLENASAVWSLWPGYLDSPSGEAIVRILREHDVPLVHVHSSGHARIEDLQALAEAIAPRRIVPIHTSAPTRFKRLFERVEPHANGEWWDI